MSRGGLRCTSSAEVACVHTGRCHGQHTDCLPGQFRQPALIAHSRRSCSALRCPAFGLDPGAASAALGVASVGRRRGGREVSRLPYFPLLTAKARTSLRHYRPVEEGGFLMYSVNPN